MFQIGRVCIKKSGREKNQICVVVDLIDHNFVLIDGNLKRKRCNIRHLDPLHQIVNIEKNASSELVRKELAALNYEVVEKASKQKHTKEMQKSMQKEAKQEKPDKNSKKLQKSDKKSGKKELKNEK